MKTKHLIVALLVIVAIFVTKGFYVTREVSNAMKQSYEQFETVTNVVRPLSENYEAKLGGSVVLATHKQITGTELVKVIDEVRVAQQKLLDEYISIVRGKETMDDKELYICASNLLLYMDRLRDLAAENDIEAIHKMIYNGEFFSNFTPLHNVIYRIKVSKLTEAENYRVSVETTLKNFDRVMMFAGTLIVILGVLAVKYKDEVPFPSATKRKSVQKKKTLKTRAAI